MISNFELVSRLSMHTAKKPMHCGLTKLVLMASEKKDERKVLNSN
jgi:hypothetical protein